MGSPPSSDPMKTRAAGPEVTQARLGSGVNAIAYEAGERPGGTLPLLIAVSPLAGRMARLGGARWVGKPGRGRGKLVSVVVDNGSYGTIRMHQEREYPGRVSGSDLINPDFAALARAYGWHAASVERTAQFEPAFADAMAADRPSLIHVRLDTDVISPRTTIGAIREAARKR